MSREGTPNVEAERPQFLYHASQRVGIKELEPRQEKVRDPEEGAAVFATPDRAIAPMFLVPANDSWSISGRYNGVPTVVYSDREKFMRLDRGGSIYKLPSSGFSFHPDKGLREDEWTNPQPVRPVNEYVYRSGLEAMLDNKVQVFFVDAETFGKMKRGNDDLAILRQQESENWKLKRNYTPFDER